MQRTKGYTDLMAVFRAADDYDPWGTTMEYWFATAETLFHAGHQVPAGWEFRHSVACDGIDTESFADDTLMAGYWQWERNGNGWSADDLIAFGNVLSRYAGMLRAAGKDY